jgi:RNA polymerase sigma-70 factor (ECF subfamily)
MCSVEDGRRQRFEREAVVHLKAVYNAAYRLTRRQDDAKDLTQEAMLRAYRAFDTFREGTNARAWLLTIVYSVFVNRFRQAQRTPVSVSIEDLEAVHSRWLAAPLEEPADPWQGAWGEAEVAAAVAQLPEAFRDTIWLVDIEELSYEEAAATLGCPVGTVRSRLARARRVLAASLQSFAVARRLIADKHKAGER